MFFIEKSLSHGISQSCLCLINFVLFSDVCSMSTAVSFELITPFWFTAFCREDFLLSFHNFLLPYDDFFLDKHFCGWSETITILTSPFPVDLWSTALLLLKFTPLFTFTIPLINSSNLLHVTWITPASLKPYQTRVKFQIHTLPT